MSHYAQLLDVYREQLIEPDTEAMAISEDELLATRGDRYVKEYLGA